VTDDGLHLDRTWDPKFNSIENRAILIQIGATKIELVKRHPTELLKRERPTSTASADALAPTGRQALAPLVTIGLAPASVRSLVRVRGRGRQGLLLVARRLHLLFEHRARLLLFVMVLFVRRAGWQSRSPVIEMRWPRSRSSRCCRAVWLGRQNSTMDEPRRRREQSDPARKSPYLNEKFS